MNQAKLGVVKQEMARVSINILGIKLKWTGMGLFNSDDHYFYYGGQESLGINGAALIVNKKSEMQYFGAVSKKTERYLCSFPRQIFQYHSNPSLCPNR